MLPRQEQNTASSPLTVHNDGFSFKGYSVRLSNFSLNKIPAKCVRFAVWSAGMGVAVGNIIGLSSIDERTHYKISSLDPAEADMVLHALYNKCDVIYDPSRQDEYQDLHCKTFYQLPHRDNHYYLSAPSLCRGHLQPIHQQTEQCLKNVLNETYSFLIKIDDAIRSQTSLLEQQLEQQERQEMLNDMVTIAPYCLATVGLFAAGYAGYYAYKWHQNKNRPPSFTERLDKINYQGEIDHEFLCPIYMALMNDPVITNDGYTYDRSAIETWLNGRTKRSPLIPTIMIENRLIKPNDALRKKIEAFVKTVTENERETTPQPERGYMNLMNFS